MKYLSFKEFIEKYRLTNEATSIVKNKRNLETYEPSRVWNIHER